METRELVQFGGVCGGGPGGEGGRGGVQGGPGGGGARAVDLKHDLSWGAGHCQ